MTPSSQRACKYCRALKPISEFLRKRLECKACRTVYNVAYNKANRARIKAAYEANKDEITAKARSRRAANPIPNMLARARVRARVKGLEFSLTKEDIRIPESCPVLGIRLRVSSGRYSDSSPALDRIDNSKGYVRGNVLVVSARANSLKNDATVDELKKLVEFYSGLR